VEEDVFLERGRVVLPRGEDLGLRAPPDPSGAPLDYWYPARRGEALTYQRRWVIAGVALCVLICVVIPLLVSVL
jgi:hypothetical protein